MQLIYSRTGIYGTSKPAPHARLHLAPVAVRDADRVACRGTAACAVRHGVAALVALMVSLPTQALLGRRL